MWLSYRILAEKLQKLMKNHAKNKCNMLKINIQHKMGEETSESGQGGKYNQVVTLLREITVRIKQKVIKKIIC